ncbi:ABC transporter ATP-binding protein [Chrysiogenes arsenatis]|uniref:ABC transporter ATP-binding protein n=1 Tax=Chrysiogenes arsenatis TaxID=309797 RepID=UPI00041685CE|nr:ABC transporter ATP-binding protein [Chrysiogenes arsenatis]
MSICQLTEVVKEYRGDEQVRPVAGINLTIQAGDFIAIEGPSGTGKSTLLYVMGGLLRATSGEVALAKQALSPLGERELTRLRASHVGFIFQEANLLPALTVLENVLFTHTLRYGKRPSALQRTQAQQLLEAVGLSERLHFLPHALSVGQRRRVAIARALAQDVPLVIADEPTNDLDPSWAEKVMQLLRSEVERGKAVVMVTHHHCWAEWATRRYRMDQGLLQES